jgi:hypothetical protein
MKHGEKKGDKSKTHKGDKDYTTKKGDKDFHEKGHDEKKKKKPFGEKGSKEMKERMAKLRAMRGKKK